MILWSRAARRFANGYEFKGPGWTVLLYDVAEPVFKCAVRAGVPVRIVPDTRRLNLRVAGRGGKR